MLPLAFVTKPQGILYNKWSEKGSSGLWDGDISMISLATPALALLRSVMMTIGKQRKQLSQ